MRRNAVVGSSHHRILFNKVKSMKCDSCKNKSGEVHKEEHRSEFCLRGHWEGSGLQDESLEWENCPDFSSK